MRTLVVERTLKAPIEGVFDVLADHGNYKQFRAISDSKLLRQGEPPPNGVGAVRWVAVPPMLRFTEEITGFDRPNGFEYLINKANLPLEHHGGAVRLEPDGDRTKAVWTSSFSVPLTGGGPAGERVWELMLRRGFNRTLEDAERIAGAS